MTFMDTLATSKMLVEAGLKPEAAEAITQAIATANDKMSATLPTSNDVKNSENTLKTLLIKMELRLEKSISSSKVAMILWAAGSQVFLLTALIALANFTKILGGS
jgi:hypothetical protein